MNNIIFNKTLKIKMVSWYGSGAAHAYEQRMREEQQQRSNNNNNYDRTFQNDDLKSIPDPNKYYHFEMFYHNCAKQFTYLMKLVLMSRKYSEVEDLIVSHLKDNPDEINKKNSIGWTALNIALYNLDTRSTDKVVSILLQGTTLSSLNVKDVFVNLLRNFSEKHSNVIEMMLEHKINVNTVIDYRG